MNDLVLDAFAGAALARLVTHDAVSMPATNRLFSLLVWPHVPLEAFAGYPDDLARSAQARLQRQIEQGVALDDEDLRLLHRVGWTRPYGKQRGWVADLLSCPICVSFHATWLSHVATGRARPLSARWWVRLFAGWGAAQLVVRQAATPESPDEWVARAIMELSAT